MSSIVYIVQPPEYINTVIYKVGYSKIGLSRIYSYGKTTRILCIINHETPTKCESALIKYFKRHFEVYKGREYFKISISENDLCNIFMDIVSNSKNGLIVNNKKIDDNDIINKKINNAVCNPSTSHDKQSYIIKHHCTCCNYITLYKSHMTVHSSTDKHIANSQNYDKKIFTDVVCCPTCDKFFVSKSSASRHKKSCNGAKVNNNPYNTSTKTLNNERDYISLLHNHVDGYKQQVTEYKKIIKKISKK
jgi:hypothetical protein